MRRVVSIILFVLGGWLFTSELMMAWIDPGGGIGMQLAMLGLLGLFGAPFLALGTWASPGRRWRELGLTLMITAGVGVFVAITTAAVIYDPSMKQYMPPDKPMPKFELSPIAGVVNLLLVAGIGWLLWRTGRGAAPAEELAERFR